MIKSEDIKIRIEEISSKLVGSKTISNYYYYIDDVVICSTILDENDNLSMQIMWNFDEIVKLFNYNDNEKIVDELVKVFFINETLVTTNDYENFVQQKICRFVWNANINNTRLLLSDFFTFR